MHKAKAFFYGSSAILALALAFHLGAKSAGAHGQVQYGAINPTVAAANGGILYAATLHPGPVPTMDAVRSIPLPRAGEVIGCMAAVTPTGIEFAHVLYADGAFFAYHYDGGVWVEHANLFGNQPVVTTPTTMGRIKAERR